MPVTPKTVFSWNLDLLRAFAVLCVYIGHLVTALGWAQMGSLGRFGVVLFFIHTSLVLMQSLDRMEVAAKGKRQLLGAFWVRRFFRIYPLSFLLVVSVAWLHIPPDPGAIYHWIGVRAFAANLLLVQNLTTAPDILSPLWSLPLEVQMYLVLPFVHLLLRGRLSFKGRLSFGDRFSFMGRHSSSLVLWGASVPLAVWLPPLNWRLQVAYFAPCFCAGVVAYDLLCQRAEGAKESEGLWFKPRLPAWSWPIALLLATAIFGPFDDVSLYHKLYRAWVLALGLGVLYVYVREGGNNGLYRVAHWIAEHSYGVYLSHIVLFWVVLRPMAGMPVWLRVVFLAVTSVAVPAALYRWIERPLMLAGVHLSRRMLQAPERRPEALGILPPGQIPRL